MVIHIGPKTKDILIEKGFFIDFYKDIANNNIEDVDIAWKLLKKKYGRDISENYQLDTRKYKTRNAYGTSYKECFCLKESKKKTRLETVIGKLTPIEQ